MPGMCPATLQWTPATFNPANIHAMTHPALSSPLPVLLAVTALAFSRNDERVFGPLDFHVDRGEALLVQGGNGTGKTTLLRVLAGLLREQGLNAPLIAVTARADADAEPDARRAGFAAFIRKPLTGEMLAGVMARALDGGGPGD